MRIHFFTVRNIEDYRQNYRFNTLAKKLFKDLPGISLEDFDQEFFYRHPQSLFKVPAGIFESRIVGETSIPGLRLDFNFGLRLQIPEGNFRVKISDADSGQVFFDKYISGGRLISADIYYIRWHIEIFRDEEKVFTHTLNLEGQPVTIAIRVAVVGDTIAMLPYFREFQRIHRCDLSICLQDHLCELAAHLYPDLKQIDNIDFKTYATYYPCMAISPVPIMPVDMRSLPLERGGGVALGIKNIPPRAVFKPTAPRITDEPYVCIAVQASRNSKGWLYPGGWDIIIDYLKRLGYRVFCIDREAEVTMDNITICKPEGAEDFTGNISLIERGNMLYHAEFFIGLSSGLAWLANAANCPVVMICGFSQDWSEFYTPYRVANRFVCNGCINDPRCYFLEDFCPRHRGTPRELECQKKITPQQVINAIEQLIIDHNLTPPALA